MGLECDMEESQEELLMETPSVGRVTSRRRTWTLVLGAVAMCGCVALWHDPNALAKVRGGAFLGLEEAEEIDALADCGDLPFVKLEEVISSNLGKQGPDKDAPEGIIYRATATNTGSDVKNLEIHVHSLKNFSVADDDEAGYDASYVPAFKTGDYVNGIHGKFACINIKQNNTLKVRAHAYDADKKEDISLPHAAISFFDLDTGYDNNHSVEHVAVAGYSAYYLSNETQIKVSHDHDKGVTAFTASKEGTGADNPKDPIELTPEQKDRAVTLELTDVKSVDFEIGASAGRTGRVFSFVFRPSMLCAKTKIHKHLYPASGSRAPIVPVKTNSGAVTGFPSVLVMLGLVSLLAQSFM